VSAHLHCNGCGYSYTATATAISFDPGMCTMMACEEPDRESEFMTAILSATAWSITGAELTLSKGTTPLLKFTSGSLPALAGTSWQLHSINQSAGRTKIAAPANYTATFQADLSVSLKADCNTCMGTYTASVNAGAFSFKPGMCTKMYCGPDSKETTYLEVLGLATGYTIRNDTLYCYGPHDTLVFRPKGTAIADRHAVAPLPEFTVEINRGAMLTVTAPTPIAGVRLYNVRGSVVLSIDRCNKRSIGIDASSLPAGVYILRATGMTGKQYARSITFTR